MNREHLQAFLWLRWRLRVNQFRKAGRLNAVFFFIFIALVAIAAIGLFVTGFALGLLAMPNATPAIRLLVWDGIIVVFLFCWLIGLFSDLQRSEGLAVDKVLHLPVSPSGAFFINYLSSLLSLTLIALVPGMIGLILGEVCAGSVIMLLAFPLLGACMLAITAVTYLFQGWLASLMTNPRRRRTVIVLVTGGFILLAQLPNMINMARPWREDSRDQKAWVNEQRAALQAERTAKKLTPQEYVRRSQEIEKEYAKQAGERSRLRWEQVQKTAWIISAAFPPGWMAIGASELAAGSVVPALLGTLGLALIGAASLKRAYRTTIRLYTGAFTGQMRNSAPQPATTFDPDRVRLEERRLPWVSEHASAVAMAAIRSMMRAPEAKMSLLAPIIMLVVFGGIAISAKSELPDAARPLAAFGFGAMVLLLSGVQLIGNQFGYDRTGFRAYVLSPISRREILLGKNLAVAPFTLGMGLALFLLVGILYPMRIDHYPATVAQLVSTYLVFCLLANGLSILAPIPMAAGSLQPAKVKFIPVMLQMVFLMVLPLAVVPLLIPIGVEVLLNEAAGIQGVPVSLILSMLMLAGTVLVYRIVLTWEGNWLAARELEILNVVTTKEA